MRQYDDPVEVRRGETEDPDQFLWRGRLWKVRAVVAHWVETGPWWQSALRPAGALFEREVLLVVAATIGSTTPDVGNSPLPSCSDSAAFGFTV